MFWSISRGSASPAKQAHLFPPRFKEDSFDYDDPLSTYARVLYSDWVLNLGGTYMWSLDADFDGHSQDLLDAMDEATHLQPLE